MFMRSGRAIVRIFFFAILLPAFAGAEEKDRGGEKAWWQKPGLGIQYQIEQRPGWNWERDFEKFQKSMTDDKGRLNFDGPLCKTQDWVALSKRVGVDYHVVETKWHDGICYFDTRLTSWKTPVDYIRNFSQLSHEQNIPFMFYYSSLIDHNPQFDDIQPLKHNTLSMIGLMPGNVYVDFLRGQLKELVEQYHPAGFWLDWYMPPPERTSAVSLKFLRDNFPEQVVTFNNSNSSPQTFKKLNYTSSEAHDLLGSKDRSPGLAGIMTGINSYGYRFANENRERFDHRWELISPCGKDWQVTSLREDKNELVRMAASTLASGGLQLIGVGTGMDGAVLPDHVRQMEIVGEWYRPRKELFRNAEPVPYPGLNAPGVSGFDEKKFGTIMSTLGNDKLLHLINFHGDKGPLTLRLKGPEWREAKKVFLEPGHREIAVNKSKGAIEVSLTAEQIDPVDTILRFED